jgi:hypothetical protein
MPWRTLRSVLAAWMFHAGCDVNPDAPTAASVSSAGAEAPTAPGPTKAVRVGSVPPRAALTKAAKAKVPLCSAPVSPLD